MISIRHLAAIFLLTLAPATAGAQSSSPVWQAIADGSHIAIMRHARAPGVGDPLGFKIGDCKTQRNLDERGEEQAKAIGEAFRKNGIMDADIRTSQWCRTRDTAKLLDIGKPEDLVALNSFFRRPQRRAQQTEELLQWLQARKPGKPLVLVSHEVNINALTGISPASGEIVVFRLTGEGGVKLRGRIRPD